MMDRCDDDVGNCNSCNDCGGKSCNHNDASNVQRSVHLPGQDNTFDDDCCDHHDSNELIVEREPVDFLNLFQRRKKEGGFTRVCAPMVRYSKVAFRNVVRRHGVDVVFTPMIVADTFSKSDRARQADFSSAPSEGPLVAQFAASNAHEFASACALISPFVDAVDLNCGCPQKWAMGDCLGAHLVTRPELIADMIKAARGTRELTNKPVSIKIRLCPGKNRDKDTVELCRRAEKCGAEWITIHGRTYKERKSTPHFDVIKLVKDSVQVPIIANGNVYCLKDAQDIASWTNADGIMSARGMLQNPALFDDAIFSNGNNDCKYCPLEVVEEYVKEALRCGTLTTIMHHHLIYMTEHQLSRSDRNEFNRLTSTAGIIEFLHDRFGIFQE
eukprot:m.14885 g.14885  ORF g.14885 m.14885 type:complete len:385 (-) comp4388_c0_seq1:120-1274(-)